MKMNIVSITGSIEYHQVHSKSDNSDIMSRFDRYGIFKKLFIALVRKYQVSLGHLTQGSNFVFDAVDGLHYKCKKIFFKGGRSYKDSPGWLKNKKYTKDSKISHKTRLYFKTQFRA